MKEQSRIGFSAVQTGRIQVSGGFEDFSAEICFDERNLAGTRAILEFDMAALTTGILERDEILAAPEWLDIENYTNARFELTSLDREGPNSYRARGRLEIKGLTKEVEFPLILDLVAQRTSGDLTIDRRDFNIGEGRWGSSEKWVDFLIGIEFDLYAQPRGENCG